MSSAGTRSKVRIVRSENRWGRSNRRHFARQNRRKKTSNGYEFEKKPRKLVLSRFTGDGWIPCPSGYTRGQGWGLLHKAWIGFKRANNPRNGESLQDKLYWASMIQAIQTDLGIARSSFSNLSLLGDVVFLYNKDKELELQEQHDELWYKEYKKEKREYIRQIVDASMMTENEIEELREEFGPAIQMDARNRYIERIIMPNLFDTRRNYHN
ncbi:MAG: hypothetical protein ACRD8Z_23355 [Nitrososphaeraceae archaeon]